MPPIDLDDKSETSISSADVETLDAALDPQAEADAGSGASGADSSDAHGDNEGTADDSLSIVRDVVSKRQEPAAASPAEGQETGAEADGSDPSKKEQDDEDYSDVPFHKHPRFQHLLRESKANRQDAVRYRNVQAFLDNNGLSADETAEGLTIMAAMKTNPVEAWKMMKPHVQALLIAAGEVLPDNLSQRVQAGELTHDAAVEIARAQARATSVETVRTFEQQRDERQRMQAHHNSLRNAAHAWEQDRIGKDPNFEAKRTALMKEVLYLQQQEGHPNTVEGVRDQLNRAYKAIAPAPAPRPNPAPTVGQGLQKPKPSASASASGSARPAPKSTLDIIQAEISKRRAG